MRSAWRRCHGEVVRFHADLWTGAHYERCLEMLNALRRRKTS